jgi:hypothetical protein
VERSGSGSNGGLLVGGGWVGWVGRDGEMAWESVVDVGRVLSFGAVIVSNSSDMAISVESFDGISRGS